MENYQNVINSLISNRKTSPLIHNQDSITENLSTSNENIFLEYNEFINVVQELKMISESAEEYNNQ